MNESKKIAGALGFYTDFISASSQTKCKPILDKLFNIICVSSLTQREAFCIATALNSISNKKRRLKYLPRAEYGLTIVIMIVMMSAE